jgi:hypothetical protein
MFYKFLATQETKINHSCGFATNERMTWKIMTHHVVFQLVSLYTLCCTIFPRDMRGAFNENEFELTSLKMTSNLITHKVKVYKISIYFIY